MDMGIGAMGSEHKGFESSKNCNPQHSRPCGEGCLRSVDGSILGRKGALFFMERAKAVLSFLPEIEIVITPPEEDGEDGSTGGAGPP